MTISAIVSPLRFGNKPFRFDAKHLNENTDGAGSLASTSLPTRRDTRVAGRRAVRPTGGSTRPVGSLPALMPQAPLSLQ
jgi:hypothetical protein